MKQSSDILQHKFFVLFVFKLVHYKCFRKQLYISACSNSALISVMLILKGKNLPPHFGRALMSGKQTEDHENCSHFSLPGPSPGRAIVLPSASASALAKC